MILSFTFKTWMSAKKTNTTALQTPIAKTLWARSSASAMMVTKATVKRVVSNYYLSIFVSRISLVTQSITLFSLLGFAEDGPSFKVFFILFLFCRDWRLVGSVHVTF